MEFASRFVLDSPWWKVFAISWISFSFLYFAFAWAADALSHRVLPAMGLGRKLEGRLKKGQIATEIRYSLISITVFAGYGLITKLLLEWQWLQVEWRLNATALPFEIAALFLWNELHFYICHRLLHIKWLYRHVHIVHHRSTVPTAFSTYSFHWIEALLLGSVMVIAMSFYPFQLISLLILPLMSITCNAVGHFHYDMFPDKPISHFLSFSRRHSLHHSHPNGNFGFLLSIFDRLFGSALTVSREKRSLHD